MLDSSTCVANCARVVNSAITTSQKLNDMRGKYPRAGTTLAALSAECVIMSTGLSKIVRIIQENPDKFSARLEADSDNFIDVPLGTALESALDSCQLTVISIGQAIDSHSKRRGPSLPWQTKPKFVWTDDEMRETLNTMRGLGTSLNFLISIIETQVLAALNRQKYYLTVYRDSVSEVQRMLQVNNVVLQNIVDRSNTIKISYAQSTLNGIDTDFSFDDQLVSSSAYRRAFRSFVRRSDSSSVASTISLKDGKQKDQPTDIYDVADDASTLPPSLLDDGFTHVSREWVERKVQKEMAAKAPSLINAPAATKATSQAAASYAAAPAAVKKTSQTPAAKAPAPATTTVPTRPKSQPNQTQASSTVASRLEPPPSPVRSKSEQSPSTSEGGDSAPKQDMDRLLLAAARGGDMGLIKTFLGRGGKLTAVDSAGLGPLHLAAWGGHPEAITFLVEKGCEVNSESQGKHTPLHYAATGGNADAIRKLMELGAKLEVTESKDGRTPLMEAIEAKKPEAVKVLIEEYKADFQKKNRVGNSSINLACMKGNLEVVEILQKHGANMEHKGLTSWTPLHHASANNHPELCEHLLKLGVDIEARSDAGYTPLHNAARWGFVKCCQVLIKHGAEKEARLNKDYYGYTPLQLAALWGFPEALETLIENGCDKESRSIPGNYLINCACIDGKVPLIELLLDKYGADIQARGSSGWTPVHHCAGNDKLEGMECLLKRGAEMNAVTDYKDLPIHVAAKGARINTVRRLVELGQSVHQANSDGETPLHLAAIKSKKDLVQILLDAGADRNAKDNKGRTPLEVAAENGNAEVATMLLD
jgi:ankyrin repeat protein